MVLEHLFPANWMEKKVRYAFVLGFGFSLLSILIARYTFGANSGIVSVIFLTIFLTPSMRKLFADEEKLEEHEKRFSLKYLYNDNKHLFEAYTGVFFGIFFAYFLATFVLPMVGINTLNIVKEQLFLDPAIAGRATYDISIFTSILSNNWIVLFFTFLLALAAGDGALFFVAWNASAWGAIFGYRALAASTYAGSNPWLMAIILLAIVIWHVILEGGAYILAAISGSVISDEIISKSKEMKTFLAWGVLVILGIFMIKYLLSRLFGTALLSTLVLLGAVVGLLRLWGHTFISKKHKEVFIYNYWLFVIAIIIFIIGACVESGVLSYSTTLSTIYTNAAMFGMM